MIRKHWLNFIQLVSKSAGLREHRGHHYYPGTLNHDSIVIDLGAHKGEFSIFAHSTYGCSILGLEANPQLHESLPVLPGVRFLNRAIHQDDIPIDFFISDNPEASSIFEDRAPAAETSRKVSVAGITLDSLIKENGFNKVGLLKVDIESAEFTMLETATEETLSKIDQITVEFHISKEIDSYSAHRFKGIQKRLQQFGFRSFVMDRNYADVLFINNNHIRFQPKERIAVAIYRYLIMPARFIVHGR